MTVEVQLQVRVIPENIGGDALAVMSSLSDYMWSQTNGIELMTVFSDGDAISDAVQAIRCARGRGIEVIRVFEDPVNIGEITRRVGEVSREAVRKWAEQPSFPAPVGASGGERTSLLWKWADIVSWLLEVKGIDMDEDLPDAQTVAAINAHITGAYNLAAAHDAAVAPVTESVAPAADSPPCFNVLGLTMVRAVRSRPVLNFCFGGPVAYTIDEEPQVLAIDQVRAFTSHRDEPFTIEIDDAAVQIVDEAI